MMRTDDEIKAKLLVSMKTDIFGFATDDLLMRLPFSHAREFLKPEATAEEWDAVVTPKDRESVLKEAHAYYNFACEKCDNERGISAGRSILHYIAWLWLMGEDELLAVIEGDCSPYGEQALKHIGEHFGWAWGELTPDQLETF